MKTTIFKNKMEKRFWISVESKDSEGKITKASMKVLLSKNQQEVFEANCRQSKNENITYILADIDEINSWLKQIRIDEEETRVCIFVNKLKLRSGRDTDF